MNKFFIATLVSVAPSMMMAQSAIDAYQITGNDLNGTARFQAMGGAFTALGGDVSSLGQNPAGIGIYRSSELSLSFDVNMQSSQSKSLGYSSSKLTQTKSDFTNAAYVGAVALNNETMPYFSWGISYNRIASFERVHAGYIPSIGTSLSNYVAAFSNGYAPADLLDETGYNPYQNSDCDWLSILAYNAYAINPKSSSSTQYNGLYQNGTDGDASFEVRERGYVDEYNIDFGGNIMNTVYWGLGLGITDMSYFRDTYYDESMSNARIPDAAATGTETGSGNIGLGNSKGITGTGVNVKLGLIFKPVNEFRVGIAVHTPTYYRLSHSYSGYMNYQYSSGYDSFNGSDPESYTDVASYDSRLNSPWRLMIGAAGVFNGRFILSADYERVQYNDMKSKYQSYDSWGTTFVSDDNVNSDISTYYQGSNILRIGGEFRALPWLSFRLGYNYQSSNVKNDVEEGNYEIYTSGTDPSFTFTKDTQYITAGAGLRYQGLYFDLAYVHQNRKSTYHAFTDYTEQDNSWASAPTASITENNNKLVFTLGYKF
jgi:hypothetical protein